MRIPGLALLLMLSGGSRCVEASMPINLFHPDTGQRTIFEERNGFNGKPMDTARFWISALSGDTANYGFLFFRGQRTGTRAFAWSLGKLTAPVLLQSRTLDTNGILTQLKTFPADYKGRTATNASRSGFTLHHVVDGFLFDTLLVSCTYEATSDVGDNCDFITPSGVLVYSSVEDCLCSPSSYRIVPDAVTLAAMGGKPVPNFVVRNSRRKAVLPFWLTDGYDIRGRWTKDAPVGASIPGPRR